MALNDEREKWNDIYASLPLIEESEAIRSFNEELLDTALKLLPEGGKTLEAGCGGGSQSLALGRSGKFKVTLLDFSSEALKYARKIFESANIPADFIQADAMASGYPAFELVFNAGVLEHYTFEQQVSLVRGMASHSKRFVLVLVPNRLCYWYWVWRLQKKIGETWPYGEEIPVADLSGIFKAAGMHFIGQKFMGSAWTETFLQYIDGFSDDLRNQLLQVHRSNLLTLSQKSYLVAGLGCVDACEEMVLPGWEEPGAEENLDFAKLYSDLSDALASRLKIEQNAEMLEKTLAKVENQLADNLQLAQTTKRHLTDQITTLTQAVTDSQIRANDLAQALMEAKGRVIEIEYKGEAIKQKHIAQITTLEQTLADYETKFVDYGSDHAKLTEIYGSRAWKLVKIFWGIRLFLIPTNSLLMRILRKLINWLRLTPDWFHKGVRKVLNFLIPAPLKTILAEYRKETPFIDNSRVTLFATPDILPNYLPRHDIDNGRLPKVRRKVTLITTVLNEEKHAPAWFESLIRQTRFPDELVITDGGSQDRTVEILQSCAARAPFPVKVLQKSGANISAGRNHSIQNAAYDLIACSDMGSILKNDWLERLIQPFELDPTVAVSCGFNTAADSQSPYARLFFAPIHEIDPRVFLPSGRSIAFYKWIWAKIDGYPEWLSDAAEDTVFDFSMKRLPLHWAFVPQANVSWFGPRDLKRVFKTARRYSFGDGEAGLFASRYWIKTCGNGSLLARLIVALAGLVGLWLVNPILAMAAAAALALGAGLWTVRNARNQPIIEFLRHSFYVRVVSFAQVIGFIGGFANRPKVIQRQIHQWEGELETILQKYAGSKGVVIYPPTHDWGFMFQRPQQIARAFARLGYLYFYCTNNEKTDTVIGFQEVEERVILCHLPLQIFKRVQSPIVYLGAASLQSVLSSFESPFVIYDHYDDLVVSSARIEDHLKLLNESRIVITTSHLLLEATRQLRPDALFLPNGVDYDFIAGIRENPLRSVPADLEPILRQKAPIVGYSGALASWFDYDLFAFLAQNNPDYEFVMVGVNYDGTLDQSNVLQFPNVHWLGVKKYDELFNYIMKFDVCIIPFKVNDITLATSPIKMYEYAACHKPVVTTALPECRNFPQLIVAETFEDFNIGLELALKKGTDPAFIQELDQLARQNSWQDRVSAIINEIDRQSGK